MSSLLQDEVSNLDDHLARLDNMEKVVEEQTGFPHNVDYLYYDSDMETRETASLQSKGAKNIHQLLSQKYLKTHVGKPKGSVTAKVSAGVESKSRQTGNFNDKLEKDQSILLSQ